MLKKYMKFELEELPVAAVVNSSAVSDSEENDLEKIINEVLIEHIGTITEHRISKQELEQFDISSNVVDSSNIVALKDINVADEELDKKNIDESTSVASISNHNSDGTELLVIDADENVESVEPEDVQEQDMATYLTALEIEAIKDASFERGYESARNELQEQMDTSHECRNFVNLLQEKLIAIVPSNKFGGQVIQLFTEILLQVVKKACLVLPVDFHAIIKDGLLQELKKTYKLGEIIISVHPKRYDLCAELIQSINIADSLKENIKIVQNSELGTDDCIIQNIDTRLEYNKEQIALEIEEIVTRMANAA